MEKALAAILGGLPGWFASLLGVVIKAMFGEIRQGIDDARDDQAHVDVGVLRQKSADEAATAKAEAEASTTALQPRDREKTIKGLEDGTF